MQTVRQAFTILKQNPLLSTISILGTAFAITMIMAIVITWQTKYADLEPEVNRSRCLYFSAMHVYDKEKDGNNNWSNPSAAFMKECVQPVSEVEYCTAFSPAGLSLASLTDGNNRVKVALRGVGSADIHVVCDYLTARMSGVGDVTLSGTAGHADISKGGIGGVNTCNLKVGR